MTKHSYNWQDHTGKRFGRLTVVRWVGRPRSGWMCLCTCGNSAVVQAFFLLRGRTRSCGCMRSELSRKRVVTHGLSKTTEHTIWLSMIQRCGDVNTSGYKNYGGRGIRVCARWRRSFTAFLTDMGQRPSPKHSLDRFPNNNGNYTQKNCRWATREQQMQNKRDNRILTFRGESLCLAVWSRRVGIRASGITYRLAHGWTLEEALTTPSRRPKVC